MSSLGKKILGAFIDLGDDSEEAAAPVPAPAAAASTAVPFHATPTGPSDKFKAYFDTLLKDANTPGPDYYEFIKMVEAMNAIPDEQVRFTTAYTGLSMQGLDKKKLLDSATQYLRIIEGDATSFNASVGKALDDKVTARKQEIVDKTRRIQELTKEIDDLNKTLEALKTEVKENEDKIKASSGSYQYESDNLKNNILDNVRKINQYIA